MLALLTKNWALDKEQAAGEGKGLAAWRGLQEQWGPKSRSRFTSMLLGILNGRFKGDAHPELREADQLRHPDFVKAGLKNGLQEEPLRRHMVLHTLRLDTNEKLRMEVTEIAPGEGHDSEPGAHGGGRFALPGQRQGEVQGPQGEVQGEPGGAHGKSPDTKEMECYNCGEESHLQRKADLEKAKAEGQPQYLLKMFMRSLIKSSTLVLRLGTRCAIPAGQRASR